MSDIQTVLTRWGVWAREHSQLDYPHIASGFKGWKPETKWLNPAAIMTD